MKIQKSTVIILFLLLVNAVSYAGEAFSTRLEFTKDSKTENLLLAFHNKYLKGHSYKQEIIYPGGVRNRQDAYTLVVNAGKDQAIILLIDDNKTKANVINQKEYAYELAVKAANSMLAKSSSLKVYSKDISSKLPGVKGGTKINLIYTDRQNEIEQILKNSIVLDYCKGVGYDFYKIQQSINKLLSDEARKYYQGYMAVMLERSAQVAVYRQAVETYSNANLGPALDNAINNSLPGVIQSGSEPSDNELIQTVNKYIMGEISNKNFNGKVDQVISARLEKSSQAKVESYQVKAVKFQIDFLINDINKKRELVNKYGGAMFPDNKSLTAFNSVAKNISPDSQKVSLRNVYKIPIDLAPLIATLPLLKVTPQFDAQTNETELQAKNEPELENVEIETVDTLSEEVAVIVVSSLDTQKEAEEIVPLEVEAPVEKNKISVTELNASLEVAVSEGDGKKIVELVTLGADPNIISPFDGNIMHAMAEKIKDEKVVEFIGNKGVSLNKLDDKGNAPLHYAIMLGKNDYAEALIKNGANVNLLNLQGFGPLHLAVYLNNAGVSKTLVAKGGNLNLQGSNGYAALHIGAEMNNFDMTKLLLTDGADRKLKTGQHLSPKAIVKIQGTKEIRKLLKTNGSYSNEFSKAKTNNSLVVMDNDNYPEVKFNLPYDDYLLSKRKTWTTVKWVSIPAFIVSAAATAYLHTQANDYYNKYQAATDEDNARYYYDMTGKYDTYSYIAGGVAVVSLYFTIHSSVKKSRIEKQLRKVNNIH